MAVANRKLTQAELTQLRLDKWLWAARFFKTRKLASEAISGGRVHVNALRVKPAKKIACGDELEITLGVDVFSVVVLGLNDKRRPACEARQLYEESVLSIEKREEAKALRKLTGAGMAAGRKPDKRGRRKIRQFKQSE